MLFKTHLNNFNVYFFLLFFYLVKEVSKFDDILKLYLQIGFCKHEILDSDFCE